jgi:hypothetical protein
MGKGGGVRYTPEQLAAREAQKQFVQAQNQRAIDAVELRKKKNPGRRDRFGRRMTFDGETVLGGRAGLDEQSTARFGATPTGGKTVLGV